MESPMRALKHTTISLLILTALSGSALANQHAHKSKNETVPQINLAEEQTKWAQQQHAHELKLIEQRATFLQLESLLKSAVKNNRTFYRIINLSVNEFFDLGKSYPRL